MKKIYTGYRLNGKNHVLVNGEPLKFPKISVGWALSPGEFDWGDVPEAERTNPRGKNVKAWNKWGRVLELSRIMLSDFFGDRLSDVNIRRGGYRSVRFFQKFAAEVLTKAGNVWEINGEEIKSWYAAWLKKENYEIYPSGTEKETHLFVEWLPGDENSAVPINAVASEQLKEVHAVDKGMISEEFSATPKRGRGRPKKSATK